jgi:hypothetical protein
MPRPRPKARRPPTGVYRGRGPRMYPGQHHLHPHWAQPVPRLRTLGRIHASAGCGGRGLGGIWGGGLPAPAPPSGEAARSVRAAQGRGGGGERGWAAC